MQTTTTAGTKPAPPRSSPSAPGSAFPTPPRQFRSCVAAAAPDEGAPKAPTPSPHWPPTKPLGDAVRGHGTGKDTLPWVRHVIFDEDHRQVRTDPRPPVLASLRNLAIAVLHLTAITNTAAARRHHAHHPDRPLRTITTR